MKTKINMHSGNQSPLRAELSDVQRLLRQAEKWELGGAEIQKLKWFAFALSHDGNVSLTCRHFAIARSTFLRWAERFDPANPETLREQSRRPHSVRAPETGAAVIEMIRSLRSEQPSLGKVHIQKILKREHGIEISASTIGRIIARHKLFFGATPSHQMKRDTANETKEHDMMHRENDMRPKRDSDNATDSQLSFPLSPKPTLPL